MSFVEFACKASDSSGEIIDDAQFVAVLKKPDGSSVPITVDRATQTGQIERSMLAAAGLYEIQLTGARHEKELGKSAFEFIVFDRDKEKANPAADPETLARLASQTESHGGQVVLPEDFGQLLQRLVDNPPKQMDVPLKWQLGESDEDGFRFAGSLFLLLFAGCLIAEWFLRKRWGLV